MKVDDARSKLKSDYRKIKLGQSASRAGEVAKANADSAYVGLANEIRELRDLGLSLSKIADRLTADGHMTRRGKAWTPVQVKRVLDWIKPAS
jgi:hypothetical protein